MREGGWILAVGQCAQGRLSYVGELLGTRAAEIFGSPHGASLWNLPEPVKPQPAKSTILWLGRVSRLPSEIFHVYPAAFHRVKAWQGV